MSTNRATAASTPGEMLAEAIEQMVKNEAANAVGAALYERERGKLPLGQLVAAEVERQLKKVATERPGTPDLATLEALFRREMSYRDPYTFDSPAPVLLTDAQRYYVEQLVGALRRAWASACK